ncbi:glycine/D-amino acid oxidase-like deaminating enzyme [Aliiruegeria haliotis]|uniref:Glycine/D-amino acid oxidase-like deaminating enzyme n=1 Tax=Aliiruegeria haliotis TaxID=1280846 RepID=A0A2T0RRI7_9RHOB|nr:FAD-dependent oxidoreductase [Aliiruegeria haliotis]PRY23816.1 glycine/D-amino acid oxidase-like deaminating enzyme [Aliiruegeria haliotis]
MADFLVIGGGIAGVSAAAELSALGSVRLLEAETALSYHASGRSAAMFLEHYGNATVRALNAASAEVHRDSEVLSQRGFLLVGKAEQEEQLSDAARSFAAERITVEEARGFLPILHPGTVAGAAYFPDAFDLDADRLLQRFAKALRANGGQIDTGMQVTSLHHDGRVWCAEAGGERIEATVVVNAAGAWADRIAALAGVRSPGIQPYRRSMARLPAPGGLDTRDWPFTDEVEEAWYAKPDAGGWIVSPAEEDPMDPHDTWADDMVIAEGLARYQDFVTEEVTRVEATWAGLRSFAPDRALVIGPDPGRPGFMWCAGQGGYGFQTAPAVARLLADLAGGRAPDLPRSVVAALCPSRFA